jgi:hypothetical protein
MCVDSAAWLSGGFNLDAIHARFDTILRISPCYDEVRVPVEVAILCKRPRVFRDARRQHI